VRGGRGGGAGRFPAGSADRAHRLVVLRGDTRLVRVRRRRPHHLRGRLEPAGRMAPLTNPKTTLGTISCELCLISEIRQRLCEPPTGSSCTTCGKPVWELQIERRPEDHKVACFSLFPKLASKRAAM